MFLRYFFLGGGPFRGLKGLWGSQVKIAFFFQKHSAKLPAAKRSRGETDVQGKFPRPKSSDETSRGELCSMKLPAEVSAKLPVAKLRSGKLPAENSRSAKLPVLKLRLAKLPAGDPVEKRCLPKPPVAKLRLVKHPALKLRSANLSRTVNSLWNKQFYIFSHYIQSRK